MGEPYKLNHWTFWAKMLSKCEKIMYRLKLLEYSRSKLLSLKCKQKLCGFTGDKNCNRREVLICKFHKQLLKVIREKTKLICKYICEYVICRLLIQTLCIPKNVCISYVYTWKGNKKLECCFLRNCLNDNLKFQSLTNLK